MLFSLVVVLVTSLLILFLKISYYRYRVNKSLRGFVSPPGLPLFGHFFLLSSQIDLIPNLLDITKKYGNFVKMELFHGFPVLLVSDKNFIGHILATKPILTKDLFYRFSEKWIGDGLITSGPEKWKKSRKIINPAFNVNLLEKYVEIFADPCEVLLELLKTEIGNDGFDVLPYVSLCSLDIICETVMGIKLNAQQCSNRCQYMDDIDNISKIIFGRVFSPIKTFTPTYMLTKDYWNERAVVERIRCFTKKVIEDRKRIRNNNGEGHEKTSSLLDVLLDAKYDGGSITEKDMINETQTFLFTGHDTTAKTVAHCLYCLSKYSEVQEKAVEELQSIFGTSKRYPTSKDLNEMRYLEMAIKETMRIYTTAPFISRLIDKDIEFGDVRIPKGVSVMIFLQGVHMNPEYHQDPHEFDPFRFQMDSAPFTFLPFSAGPRNCIGQRFAMLEMKYILCQILRQFVVLPVPNHVPVKVVELLLRFKNGAMIKLKTR